MALSAAQGTTHTRTTRQPIGGFRIKKRSVSDWSGRLAEAAAETVPGSFVISVTSLSLISN